MNEKTYSLILAAKPNKNYTAGWLAGSVSAHLIACELNGKVFWFCPVQLGRGVKDSDKDIFKRMINKIVREKIKVGKSYDGLKLSRYGYFYDADFSQVSWRFELEKIFQGNHFNDKPKEKEDYKEYFAFRDVYLEYEKKDAENCYWFLISNIQKIKNPIKKTKIGSGTYKLPGFKFNNGVLLTVHFRWGGAVFVHAIPEACHKTEEVKAEDEIDSYLKQFFLTKLPKKNLREKAIQQAFAINLMNQKFPNWSLTMEDKLKSGKRTDILFRDENGALVVVEIKRGNNDDPVTQLKNYIDELKTKHKKENIRGIVICGNKTPELEEKAKKEGFEIIEYSISVNF